jgi:beta-glucosidase
MTTAWRRMAIGGACAATLVATVLAVPAGAAAGGQAPPTPRPAARPWTNAALSPDQRANLVLAQMTLPEKVDLMTGNQGEAPYAYYNAPIVRLGIPALKMADASAGIAPRGWSLVGTGPNATAMPSSQAMGATWSLEAVRRYATVIADEVLETGQNVMLGPDGDIVRLPWWGRINETPGEDPVLNAQTTTVYDQVVQSKHVIADQKHYTAYNQETNRGGGQNSIVDERTLREVYTLAFESAVKRANIGSVMCSFNKINGEYSCQNAYTLRTILKGRIGFTGFVLTDFGAIHATLPALNGGTDMETGTTTIYDGALLAAIENGSAPLSQVNEACLRILRTMFRIGVFDRSYTPSPIPVAAHDAVARQTEEQAITLLKNTAGVLPLPSSTQSIALIGADANILAAPSGAPWVSPTRTTSVLQGILGRAASRTSVRWVRGNDPVNAANALETAGMTAVPSSVLTPSTGGGNGLSAFYWSNDNFQGAPSTTRTDPQVKFDVGFLSTFGLWGGQTSQYPNPPTGAASAVWTGTLVAPSTGDYTLNLSGWGDATLSLGGNQVITLTGANGVLSSVSSPVLHLLARQAYPIRVTYRADHPFTGLEGGTLLLQWRTPAGASSPAIRAAAAAAAGASVAVVYVRTFESEQRDRLSLKLPESADQLIAAVRAANPRTVVVLANSGPVTMPWLGSVPSVVETYFGGQAQGAALARVLWGDVNPSGKLTVTYPRSESAVPPTLQNPLQNFRNLDVVYGEGVNVGYKGYARYGVTPLFPFGYGLSYTRFAYSGLSVSAPRPTSASIHVRFTVRNTGARAGAEVAQVYLRLPGSTREPVRLAGFAKVNVARSGRATVDVTIDPTAPWHPLGWFNTARQRWEIARGTYQVSVGASARDIRLTGSFRVA